MRERARRGTFRAILARLALVASVCSGWAADAWSAPLPRISLLDEGRGPLARRLRAELVFVGLAPTSTMEGPELGTPSVSRAGAVVRILSERAVQIEILDAEGRRTEMRTLRASAVGTTTFPVEVVEQLRALLVDLGFEVPNDASEVPDDSLEDERGGDSVVVPVRAPARPVTRDAPLAETLPATGSETAIALWGHAGPAGQIAAGGLGAAFAGVGAVGVDLGSLGFAVSASFPFTPLELSEARGEAEVSIITAAIELRHLLYRHDRWLVNAGLGAGISVLSMEARAETPFVANDRQVVCGRYYVQVSLARELEEWLRVGVGLAAGMNSPRPVLRFDQQEVASAGPAFATLAVEAELRWLLTRSSNP